MRRHAQLQSAYAPFAGKGNKLKHNVFAHVSAITLAVGLLGSAVSPAMAQPGDAAYLDSSKPAELRAADLVARMTLDEKASQLLNHAAAIPRLGVPEYDWWNEGLHGVVAPKAAATVFPEPIGLAASFNTKLVHKIANAIGDEARINHERAVAAGRHTLFEGLTFYAPNINIFRDPRWGRGQETYGEDPYLTARMGVAYITGLQGNDPEHLKVSATAKHFAVHSGPEPSRHTFDSVVSRHDLEDTYLPAFRAAVVEGKVASVMCSYNAVNGTPACANTDLLQSTLRDRWHFKGFVASDCNAVTDIFDPRHVVATPAAAAGKALRAGMDNECLADFAPTNVPHSQKYVEAVNNGLLSESEINRALIRSFSIRFRLGMFDAKAPATRAATLGEGRLDTAARIDLALQAANESMVLLKNNGVLPLAGKVKRILVTGSLAADIDVLLGNYHGRPFHAVTALEGIRKAFPQAEIVYEPGTYFPADPSELVDDTVLTTNDGQAGLTAQFFAGPTPTGTPFATQTVSKVDINDAAAMLHRSDTLVSVICFGWLTPKQSGTYRLGVKGTSDRIFLDGKLIVDDSAPHAPGTKTAEVTLVKGQRYAIKVESMPGLEQVTQLVWQIVHPDVLERAAAAAKSADLVIAVAGITSNLEGEDKETDAPGFKGGDRTTIEMPSAEEDLLKAVKASGKPLVLVMMNGSALSVNWAKEHADAILEAWYPGQAGGTAIAETLAGINNPAGRLPVTFYTGVAQLPSMDSYSMAERTYRYFSGKPLYPFGYGLSYSKFSYGKMKLSSTSLAAGKSLKITATVRNISKRNGDEVVQLYLNYPKLPGAPLRALRGFQRVHLKAGQSAAINFRLAKDDLSHVTPEGVRMISAGTYQLSLGAPDAESAEHGRRSNFHITGSALIDDAK
jgi:beta-glucosidase